MDTRDALAEARKILTVNMVNKGIWINVMSDEDGEDEDADELADEDEDADEVADEDEDGEQQATLSPRRTRSGALF